MSNTKPKVISNDEWAEIMKVREVRESWGMDVTDTVALIKSLIYGVKFNFQSGGPGYCGDLFILTGDTLETNMVLYRKNGKLTLSSS